MIRHEKTQECTKTVKFLVLVKIILFVNSHAINPILYVQHLGQYVSSYPLGNSLDLPGAHYCLLTTSVCPLGKKYKPARAIAMNTVMPSINYNTLPIFRTMYTPQITNPQRLFSLLATQDKRHMSFDQSRRFASDGYHSRSPGITKSVIKIINHTTPASMTTKNPIGVGITAANSDVQTKAPDYPLRFRNVSVADEFMRGLDRFERDFYMTTFNTLTSISPEDRRQNGMSFVQSGLFLYLTLMVLSTEVDALTKAELEKRIMLKHSNTEKIEIVRQVMSLLPNSSEDLKFSESSRLVLRPGLTLDERFPQIASDALRLRVHTLNATDTPSDIAHILNQMVADDSGGAIRDTFSDDELSEGVTAVLVTTLYFRARWRAAPTVLNGTRVFRDADLAPKRNVRMIRINDVMKYAYLKEWDAEAVEIAYSRPGLSFLMLVPRGRSLRRLSEHVTDAISLSDVTRRMRPVRLAATLPLYTLRMTLLLPNKLRDMGISRLLDCTDAAQNGTLRISHAIQRLMFWAEAGRNAFKDDGIEWDTPPEMELVVDRPYIFFVRWLNLTLLNGHFVL